MQRLRRMSPRLVPGLALALALVLLTSCGGSSAPRDAMLGNVAVASQAPGPTPFISHVGLEVERADLVRSVSYTIAPKPGTVSQPVSVTYGRGYLVRRGLLDVPNRHLDLPVFGLYAHYPNHVSMRIAFTDGSSRAQDVVVDTPAYEEAAPRYTAPEIRMARRPGSAPGFAPGDDFLLLKNDITTPVVVDTDGNLRWAGTGVTKSIPSTFDGKRFLVGSGSAPTLYRIELDGTTSSVGLDAPDVADFHHDLAPGKTGLLAELDTAPGGVPHPGTVLAEIDADGHVLRQWDMATIFRAAMAAGGDDPSGFVRDGVDWFHMNSAIYVPDDDALLVSSRENFVVKLDYATGRIRWLLGDPAKYWYVRYPSLRALALAVTAGKPPVGQHALSIAPDGNLLMINNGAASQHEPPGAPAGSHPGFSAVSKYAIDEAARTAAEVWTYEHGRDLWADICSSAYQTGQGGYVIDYASVDARTHARLVGLDADGNVAFDYQYPTGPCETMFSATPIAFDALVLDD